MTTVFTRDANWLDWSANPTRPALRLPPGSVDAHCHVFGPADTFAFSPDRKYTPCDASKEELFALRDFLGFDRSVIVQATCHGTDNSAMVDALHAANGRARGVADIKPNIPDEELLQLHHAGVRGVRFNYVRRLVDPQPDKYYHRIIERIAPLGWHVVVYFEAEDLANRWDFFTSLETVVVVDHIGRPDVTQNPDGPEFGLFLRLMDEHENFWSKVTCPERLSVAGPPYDDVVPFARRIVERYPERVLSGTDWPHPNMKTHMPDDGVLVDFISRIATTDERRQQLLVDNPQRLYWKK